jgi:peptide/nickel transport system permease protein
MAMEDGMARLAATRLTQLIPLLLVGSVVVFLLLHLAPGDPALLLLGADAGPEAVEKLRESMGLDKPLPTQFLIWLNSILHGDFGVSYAYKFPVQRLLVLKIPATIELAVASWTLAVVIAFPSGILAALKKGSRFDLAVSAVNALFLAIPHFWLGIIFMLVFALWLGWLPPSGRAGSIFEQPGTELKFLILPTLTLGIPQGAALSRFIKACLLEVLSADYMRTARAKGLPERTVILRHGLRNALIPVVTIMGVNMARLLGGAVVVETVFSWGGLGQLLIEAIQSRDYSVVQACLLVAMAVVVVINTIVDITCGLVDPRIRE